MLILKKLEAMTQGRHNLLQWEIAQLAKRLFRNGFSPFDTDRLIGHVSTQKFLIFKNGTHFQKDKQGTYYMCKPCEVGAVRMTYKKVRTLPFRLPLITYKDMTAGLRQIHATNGKNADSKFDQWKIDNKIE